MLSDEDKSWIAENIMRGGDAEGMCQALTQAGRHPAAVTFELAAALQHPYLVGARRMGDVWNHRLLKAYWVLESLSKLSHLDDSRSRLAVEHDLDATRFYRDFYCANRPVLIKGEIREWPALQLWTTDYLKERWGDALVEVQGSRESSRHFETRAEQHTKSMSLKTFIDVVERGPTNDIYMTARNSNSNRVALQGLWAETGDIERYLTPHSPRAGFFWFGPKGTITPVRGGDKAGHWSGAICDRGGVKSSQW